MPSTACSSAQKGACKRGRHIGQPDSRHLQRPGDDSEKSEVLMACYEVDVVHICAAIAERCWTGLEIARRTLDPLITR